MKSQALTLFFVNGFFLAKQRQEKRQAYLRVYNNSSKRLEYRLKHKEAQKARSKKHYVCNRQKMISAAKVWAIENKEKRTATCVRYNKKRLAEDVGFRLLGNLRNRVRAVLKGINKSAKTVTLVGCSVEELKSHLKKQFRPGMTWDNYGPVWHVDHIRPCASFDLLGSEQQKICFHFSNLQPLWALDNIKKGASYGPRN